MEDESAGASPAERVAAAEAERERALDELEAELAAIAAELRQARAAEAAVYARLEAAVREMEPRLGATRVMNATGLSRGRVYQLVPKKGKGPQGPKVPRATRLPKAAD